jgi:hypothetical protein
MDQHTSTTVPTTIGLDLGARVTQVAIYNTAGIRIEERKISTSRESIEQLLDRFPGARIDTVTGTPPPRAN